MIRYSQQDPRWKNKKLGDGDCTIGSDGCFLTCFAMLLETPPDVVNDRVKTFGGFDGSLIIARIVPNAYKQIYDDGQVFCPKTDAPIKMIDDALSNSKAVIVQTDTKLDPGIQSHFVILTGKVGNDYNMVDPWPLVDNPPATLLGRYGHGRDAKTVITYVLILGGVSSASDTNSDTTAEPDIEHPQTETNTLTAIDDVNIRLKPSKNAPDIGDLKWGQVIELLGQSVTENGIEFVDFRAWVARKYLG
jgi:hypothetical protein